MNKNQNPTISVIVPVYNNERYIGKCIESFLAQTFEDFELIIIDDGSTDNTPEIIEVFEKKDHRIKSIKQQNKGVSSARNKGLDEAKGAYIMFVDGDDYIEPTTLEDSYAYITQYDADVCIFNYQTVLWNQNKQTQISPYTLHYEGYFEDAPKEFFNRTPSVWGKLFRNNHAFPRFDEKLKKGEDALFWWSYCADNPKIYATNKIYYNYMQHEDSVVKQKDLVFECDNIRSAQTLLSLPLLEKISKQNQARIFNRYAFYILKETMLACDENPKWPKHYRRAIGNFLMETYSKEITNLRAYYTLRNLYLEQTFPLLSKIYQSRIKNGVKSTKIFGLTIKRKMALDDLEDLYIKRLRENLPKNKQDIYLLTDCTYDVAECTDAYSLFLYMKQKGLKVYYVLLKENPLYEQLVREDKLDHIIVLPDNTRKVSFCARLYDTLLQTKAIIASYDIEFFHSDFWANNPYFKYIYLQHGQSYLKESIFLNGYLAPQKFSHALIPSEFERRVFKKYGWRDEQFIKAPLPRWDLLPQKSAKNKKVLIMFTWRRGELQFEPSLFKQRFLSLLEDETFAKYVEDQKLELYFAFHHEFLSDEDITLKLANKNVVPLDKVSKYIKECSLLITDFSSVAFDFMFQNKPVLFYLIDHDDPNLSRSDRRDVNNMGYKKYLIGNVFYSWQNVFEKLKYYVEKDFTLEKTLQEKYNKFFYFKNDIRKILTDEIEKICSKDQETPERKDERAQDEK